MADTFIPQTDGAGTKVHSISRVVGGQTVHDEVVQIGLHGLIGAAGPVTDGTDWSYFVFSNLIPPEQPYGPIFVPHPYYYYLTGVTIRQTALATSDSIATFELRIATDGTGDCRWQGEGVIPGATPMTRLDKSDPVAAEPGASITDRFSTRYFGALAMLSVPMRSAGPITNLNSASWAGRKPVRMGPGPSTKGILVLTGGDGGSVNINYEGYVATY